MFIRLLRCIKPTQLCNTLSRLTGSLLSLQMQGWIEREKQGYYKGQEEDKILYYAGGAGEQRREASSIC